MKIIEEIYLKQQTKIFKKRVERLHKDQYFLKIKTGFIEVESKNEKFAGCSIRIPVSNVLNINEVEVE